MGLVVLAAPFHSGGCRRSAGTGIGRPDSVFAADRLHIPQVAGGLCALIHGRTGHGPQLCPRGEYAFVWLHSLAVLAGGIFFALVWFPEHEISTERALATSGVIVLIAILIAAFSAAYPENIPAMVGRALHPRGQRLNFLGGGLTLLGALNFALRYARGRDLEDLLFLILALFFGLPGVLFQLSDIWEAGWWFWHALRLAAYGIAFWLALLTYRKFEGQILRTQSELDTLFHTQLTASG
jgi:hypothetical protein